MGIEYGVCYERERELYSIAALEMYEIIENSFDFFFKLLTRLLKGLPNTYAYTKALTEDLVNSFSERVPIVITRPSIGLYNCKIYFSAKNRDSAFFPNLTLARIN